MIRGEDLVLANIEEPDFGFVDPNRPDAKKTAAKTVVFALVFGFLTCDLFAG